jgi:membrane protease YdiL (CAAX protease family)
LVASGEFIVGALVVIAHNIIRIIPNEVPILVVAGLLSARLWSGRWQLPGLNRPRSWFQTILFAVAAAVLRLVLSEFVIEPLGKQVWPPPTVSSAFDQVTGNPRNALATLLLMWTFAAFGEEFAFRGYLLSRFIKAAGGSTSAAWIGVIVVGVLFGIGHYYKGPVGMIDSAVAGVILGAVCLLTGRNLWAAILAHGLIDTYCVMLLYFGWAS